MSDVARVHDLWGTVDDAVFVALHFRHCYASDRQGHFLAFMHLVLISFKWNLVRLIEHILGPFSTGPRDQMQQKGPQQTSIFGYTRLLPKCTNTQFQFNSFDQSAPGYPISCEKGPSVIECIHTQWCAMSI